MVGASLIAKVTERKFIILNIFQILGKVTCSNDSHNHTQLMIVSVRRGVVLSLYHKVQKMIHSYQHELLLLDSVVVDNETNTF